MGKFYIVVALVVGLGYWARTHVHSASILEFARTRENEDWGHRIEYYWGVIQFTRDRFPEAEKAFDQLLASASTAYYLAPAARIKLGRVCKKSLKWHKALRQFEFYVKTWPDGEQIRLAEKNVMLIKNR